MGEGRKIRRHQGRLSTKAQWRVSSDRARFASLRSGVSRCREKESPVTTSGSSSKPWRRPTSPSSSFREKHQPRAHMDDIKKLLANGREAGGRQPSSGAGQVPAVSRARFARDLSGIRRQRRLRALAAARFLRRPQAAVTATDAPELVRAARRFRNRPLFVYAGTHSRRPLVPGLPRPRGSGGRSWSSCATPGNNAHDVRFDRFQLLDSDFA